MYKCILFYYLKVLNTQDESPAHFLSLKYWEYQVN